MKFFETSFSKLHRRSFFRYLIAHCALHQAAHPTVRRIQVFVFGPNLMDLKVLDACGRGRQPCDGVVFANHFRSDLRREHHDVGLLYERQQIVAGRRHHRRGRKTSVRRYGTFERYRTARRVDRKACAGIPSDHFGRQSPAYGGGFAQERMILAHQQHGSRPKQKPLATGRWDVITARQPQIDATVLQIGPEVRRTRLQRDAKLRSPQTYLIENPIENFRHHQTARGDEEA